MEEELQSAENAPTTDETIQPPIDGEFPSTDEDAKKPTTDENDSVEQPDPAVEIEAAVDKVEDAVFQSLKREVVALRNLAHFAANLVRDIEATETSFASPYTAKVKEALNSK